MPSKRAEFPERVKAEIFARDRALCSYTGQNLWRLDHGASPGSEVWIDHIHPASRGGAGTVENGACSNWLYNRIKKAGGGSVRLFYAGLPTVDYYTLFGIVPKRIADHFKRFALLHWTDYYPNKAVNVAILAAAILKEPQRKDGANYKRDLNYWCNAVFASLATWRELRALHKVPTLARRKLLPKRPTEDQRILIEMLDAQSIPQIRTLVRKFAPYYYHSWRAVAYLAEVQSREQALELLREAGGHPLVVPRARAIIRANVKRLWQ
ncbi:MAG: hypothetical protein U1F48_20070 [Burkholderiales bacterium]